MRALFEERLFRLLSIVLFFFCLESKAQVAIRIDALADKKPVSPFIYGRNNSFSSTDPTWTLPSDELVRLRDAGVRFFRENGGNNTTKYNWRRKLGSHPDWYNNVYFNNWDQTAKALQENFPFAHGMWAFQLLGYAAKSNQYNFNDWGYNQSQWWEGVNQNLAGNGVLNPTGTKALKDGDYQLYLEKWDADSTTDLIKHWFSTDGIGLDKDKNRYWNMDNEPEIWSGTHDDVMPVQISAEEFMQRYIAVAKKAREKFPEIKLVGPVTANEWQWYNWNNKTITVDGKNYPWLEYFIKTIAEEQKTSGVKLLDVLDIHFYPSTQKTEEVVQLHRVFFDKTFSFPEANGVKNISGSYDNRITQEYIFVRCNEWLEKYLGSGHGVTLALTETGLADAVKPPVTSVWYASMMGEFMRNGVEIFTPWTWKTGMWETLHLFSLYNRELSISGISDQENLVSAYPTITASGDSMTVVLVNRSATLNQDVKLTFEHFNPAPGAVQLYTLSQLPDSETFKSKSENALKKSTVNYDGGNFNVKLPPMSVTSIQLRGGNILAISPEKGAVINVFPNPTQDTITIKWDASDFENIQVVTNSGKVVYQKKMQKSQHEITLNQKFSGGSYIVQLSGKGKMITKKLIIN